MEEKAIDHKSIAQEADETEDARADMSAAEDLNDSIGYHENANLKPTGKIPQKKPKSKEKRCSNGLAALGLLLNFGIIAVLFVAWKFLQEPLYQLQQSQSEITELREDVQLHDHDTKDFSDDVNRITLLHRGQEKQIFQLKESLGLMQTRVAGLTTTTKEDWLFAEAEYLLRLANQRIAMGKDVVGAEALLLTADQILKNIDDTAFYAVRDAIAHDITTIRLLESIDITGLYLQLSSIKKRINDLKLEYDFDKLEESLNDAPLVLIDQETSVFSRLWQSIKDNLSNYIIIQNADEQIKHLMLPEEQYYLTQNLRFMLEQAQLGLLSANQAVYEDSLGNASAWLTSYFPTQDMAIKMIENLQLMQTKKIVTGLPDISGSLTALQQYIKLSHSAQSRQQPQVREKINTGDKTQGTKASDSDNIEDSDKGRKQL